MCAAVLAVVFANSPLEIYYELFLHVPVEVRVGDLQILKPLLLWINDGLMAVFFFLVGLELKREFLQGELTDKKNIILPGVGALGGMLIPALIYVWVNYDNKLALQGWAIPTATDIAFALGVLALLGSRVPVTIKVFLTSLAIFDDVGAIIIIAIFYTSQISLFALTVVALCVPVLYFMNRSNVLLKSPYILIGIIMWVATLKSGVHATLAGVLLAMFIPLKTKNSSERSPLRSLEDDLHPVVYFFVLPMFAFANAGVNLGGFSLEKVISPVPLGIILGLFIGKQVGIFAFCWAFIKMKWTRLPEGMNWASLYGTALLCGIGFTMSLFIGSLAFEHSGVNQVVDERLGIIIGSILSGGLGYLILNKCLKKAD